MNWIKQHKVSFILFILILIITPPVINRCLYLNIPTHNTTDGDWLGFWGSFLGSIIGGVATLWGVIITINQEESNKKVMILPLQNNFEIKFNECIIDSKGKRSKNYIIHKYYDTYELEKIKEACKSNDDKISMEAYQKLEPFITIINVGNKNALNVSVEWEPCKFSDIRNVIEYQDETRSEWKKIPNSEFCKKNISLLRNGDLNNETNIYLGENIQKCIFTTLYNMKHFGELISIPIGVIKIKSKDISGKVYCDDYKITLDEICGAEKCCNFFTINFLRCR